MAVREILAPSMDALQKSRAAAPMMPVINSEVSYEALLDRIPADIPRLMFWTHILSGAAGHTYGANGIWQLNRKGQEYGKSPHGGNYGTIPWDQAMRLPGSAQLALAKRLFEQYDWHRFEPHPEWVAPAGKVSDKLLGPYAAGIPGIVRIVYLPVGDPVVLHGLEMDKAYQAKYLDPVKGTTTALGQAPPRCEGIVDTAATTGPGPRLDPGFACRQS